MRSAHSMDRRLPHDGHRPRALQENGRKRSWEQSFQCGPPESQADYDNPMSLPDTRETSYWEPGKEATPNSLLVGDVLITQDPFHGSLLNCDMQEHSGPCNGNEG